MKHLKRKPAKKGFIQQVWMKKTFFSLLFITTLAACTNDDVISEPITQSSSKLNITVGLNTPQSRAGIITGSTLADGSTIGILLDDGAETDYDAVNNIKFTASTQDAKQVWTPASDIVLSDTKGTLYAYYPYAEGTDLSAIPVETATQTDYLYATPVQNVNESNASVAVTMNHMLSNIKVSIARGTYVGTGNISNITIQSDGLATGGTFNAAQATPAFSSVTGTGEAITQAVNTTLGGTATNIMVVPTGTSKVLTFTATIDDVDYTVTSSDVELEEGNSYEYILSLNSTFMSVASVAVNPWTSVTKESLTLEKYVDTTPQIFAVKSDGSLIDVASADNSCIGVALKAGEHQFMIEKTQSYDATNTKFYWCKEYTNVMDVAGNTEISTGWGYLPQANGTYYTSYNNLSSDITTWTSGTALGDFNGKDNTNAIITAYAEHSVEMNPRDMCKVLQTFNAGTYGSNQGFTDWYIPAEGQLALIYLNKTAINEALTAIGGTTCSDDFYWSSSEYSDMGGCHVNFSNGEVNKLTKDSDRRVCFVRDI